MRLKDKVAIVTGASSGIGQATAQLMAREGAAIVIADINIEGMEKVAQDIRKSGGRALAIKTDIANNDEVKQTVEKTIAQFGRLDILVNNAAHLTAPTTFLHERDMAQVENEIGITLTGTIRCCRAVIPQMIRQKSGRIISVTSDSGKHGTPRVSIYSACKAGVAGLTRAIAQELATEGITVNCVAPGAILTQNLASSLAVNPEVTKPFLAQIPMGRMGEPEDIAKMIVFLASDDAKYITGQDYSVDGGLRM